MYLEGFLTRDFISYIEHLKIINILGYDIFQIFTHFL